MIARPNDAAPGAVHSANGSGLEPGVNGPGVNGIAGQEDDEHQRGRARELTMHILRMAETRLDAARVAVHSEVEALGDRLKLQLLFGGAIFLALWSAVVLIAVALPAELRVPVLSAVVAGFVVLGVIARIMASRKADSHGVGSMRWFLDSIKLDMDVIKRNLSAKAQQQAHPQPTHPSPSPAVNTAEGAATVGRSALNDAN